MKNRMPTLTALVSAFAISFSIVQEISAQDWTQEGGPNRNFDIPKPAPFQAEWPSGVTPPVLWKASVGRGTSPVVLTGDKVITLGGWQQGSDPAKNKYIPLDPYGLSFEETAKAQKDNQAWLKEKGFEKQGTYALNPLLAKFDGNAVSQAIHREDTYASCFEASTGKLLWRTLVAGDCKSSWLFGGNSYTRASPLIADGKAYFHSFDGQLACVQVSDGKLLWQANLKDHAMTMYDEKGGNGASPLLMESNIIVQYMGHSAPEGTRNKFHCSLVAAFNAQTGKRVWMTEPEPDVGHRPNLFSISGGVIDGKPTVLLNTGHLLRGFDARTGAVLWTFSYFDAFADLRADSNLKFNPADTTSGFRGSNYWRLAYAGQMALIWGDCIIDRYNIAHQQRSSRTFCIKIENGKPKLVWENKDLNAWRTTFSARDGKLYAEDHNENQWVSPGNASQALAALEAIAKGELANKALNNEIYRRPRPMGTGQFACYDIATGKMLWSTDAIRTDSMESTPWMVSSIQKAEAENGLYSKLGKITGEPDFMKRILDLPGGNWVYGGEQECVLYGDHVISYGKKGVRIARITGNGLQVTATFFPEKANIPTLSPPILSNGLLYIRVYNENPQSSGAGGNLLCFDLRLKENKK